MLLKELLERYRVGLTAETLWIYGAGAFAALASIRLLVQRPRHVSPVLRWLLFIGVAVFGVTWAWRLLWLADDAFFAFRYAENFARGNGLVFNLGERVEGYTDFLWVVLLGALAWAGVDIPWASVVLSLSAVVGVLLLATRLANRLAAPRTKVIVSFAALLSAANYIMANYGTSGLETMLGAFFVLLTLDRGLAGQPLAAGIAGIAASLTHPDHMLFYLALGAAYLAHPNRMRTLLRYGLPLLTVFVPYYLWRWHYYGDFFPNTYYAKSADHTYFNQGTRYVLITFVAGGLFAALPLAIWGALKRWQNLVAQYFLISTPLFVVYVTKIGGDFMLGRLFVPVLPVLFLMAECGVRDLFAHRSWWVRPLGIVGLAGLCFAAIPVKVIKPAEKAWHVADERTFYPTSKVPLAPQCSYAHWARTLNQHVVKRNVRPKIAFASAGIIAYETGLPIIDNFGLTDRHIAHLPIRQRGRPGHEKHASPTYLIFRNVDISEGPVYPEPYARKTTIVIDGLIFSLASFKANILDPLKGNPQIRFLDIRDDISEYDPNRALAEGGLPALECDLWFYEQYYFSNNTDENRRHALRQRVTTAVPGWAGLESFLLSDAPRGWRQVHAFHFEQGENWQPNGQAWDHGPSSREAPGQSMVFGNTGNFASSATARTIDDVTGTLLSPPFEIRGEVITLRVGGGRAPDTQRVSLLLEGRRIFSATGCSTEILSRRIWNVADWIGRLAQIEVADTGVGGWQHVLADEIVQWKRQ